MPWHSGPVEVQPGSMTSRSLLSPCVAFVFIHFLYRCFHSSFSKMHAMFSNRSMWVCIDNDSITIYLPISEANILVKTSDYLCSKIPTIIDQYLRYVYMYVMSS